MLAYTTGRVVVTPAASARSNARALRTPSGATARRGAILRVRVVGGGAATRRASHVAAALGSGDDDDEGFADIDRIAEEDEAARTGSDSVGGLVAQSREDELMSIGSHEVVEFGLSGRPLYVCQSMWWLRLSQLKTYPRTRWNSGIMPVVPVCPSRGSRGGSMTLLITTTRCPSWTRQLMRMSARRSSRRWTN